MKQHEQIGRDVDCIGCPMPQILRRADRRTQGDVPTEWDRFLDVYNAIQTAKENGLNTDYAIIATWGEMTDTDFEFIMAGMATIDRTRAKLQREKMPQQNGQHPHAATKIQDPFSEFN